MNLPIVIGGGLGAFWLFTGFIGARLFWYWWSKGKIGFAIEPIPFFTTTFATMCGPFTLIQVVGDYVRYPKVRERERLENEKLRQFLDETSRTKSG